MTVLSLKVTLSVLLITAYDDGAGNTCKYFYKLLDAKEVVLKAADLWKLNTFQVAPPAVAITARAAYQLGTSVGAPPAFGTRNVDVTTGGLLSFVDANEEVYSFSNILTLTEAPDNNYSIWDFVSFYETVGKYASVVVTLPTAGSTTFTLPTEDSIIEDSAEWGLAGHTITFVYTVSSTESARSRLPGMTFAWAEGDLLSTPYNGQMIEAAVKGIMIMARARKGAKKLVGAAVVEIAAYMQGDGPLDVLIPEVLKVVRCA